MLAAARKEIETLRGAVAADRMQHVAREMKLRLKEARAEKARRDAEARAAEIAAAETGMKRISNPLFDDDAKGRSERARRERSPRLPRAPPRSRRRAAARRRSAPPPSAPRRTSLRIGVHHTNGVVWEPV